MPQTTRLSGALKVVIRRLPEFASVKITGPASLPAFIDIIQRLGEESRRAGDQRMLVDLLEIEGTLKFTDHFQIGEQAARHLQHLEKLASVVPPDQITRTSEKVALQQGMQLRVFTSMTEAIQWLVLPAPRMSQL